MVAEYVAGATAAELGRRYGVAKSSVLRLVRHAGQPVRHLR
jgi:DNA-binding MurR/RpiR family transcriptional regulator